MPDRKILDMISHSYGFSGLQIEKYFQGYGSKYVALLHSNEGRFILKGVHHSDERFFHIYRHLKTHRYPHMFTIRAALDGRLFLEADGVVCYVYEYVDGKNITSAEGLFFQLGKALGQLHSIEVDADLPHWNVNSLLSDIENDRIPFVSFRHQSLLKECHGRCTQLLSLPKAVIHGDVAESNGIRHARDNQIVLIDWDGCGVAPRIIDPGYVLFGLLSDDLGFQWKYAEQFIAAYTGNIALTDEERRCMIYAALVLPLNNILIGDTELKISKIQWFLQNQNIIAALWSKSSRKDL